MSDPAATASPERAGGPKKGKTALRVLAGLGMLAILLYLGRHYLRDLRQIAHVSALWWAALAGLYLVMRAFQGEVFRAAVGEMDIRLGVYESFMLAMVVSLTNLVLPRAGMGAPALYLKTRHGLGLAQFASLLLPTTVLQLTCIGLVGLLCQGYLYWRGIAAWNWPLAGCLAGLLLASLAMLACPARVNFAPTNRLTAFLRRFLESWELLRRNRRLMWYILLMNSGLLLVQGVRLWACYRALGYTHVSPAAAVVASFMGQVGMLVSVVPGGLGFREGAIMASASALGVDASISATAAVLDRAVMTAIVSVVGLIGLYQFIRPALADRQANPANPEKGSYHGS